MLKIVPPNAYDFEEPRVTLLDNTASARRLRKYADAGVDRKILSVLREEPPRSGEVPVRLIALGSGEYFGPNRNGDYFSEEACKKYAHTFVKHARFYRHHRHNDKSRSYGIVKAAVYNDDAHRIELLVYLNGTKEAADRNGGLVADQEIKKLRDGEEIGVSMSCRVPYDVCSGCGNKARSRAEYCTESTCVKYGGLRNNIGRTFDDGHTLCALNPICDWFDISHVTQPADRIAWILGEVKSASVSRIICGAELAEIVFSTRAPQAISDADTTKQLKALRELSKAESALRFNRNTRMLLKSAALAHTCRLPSIPPKDGVKVAQLISSLHKYGLAISPTQFSQVFKVGDFSAALPGVFGRLSRRKDLYTLLRNNPYMLYEPSIYDETIEKQAADRQLGNVDTMMLRGNVLNNIMISRHKVAHSKAAALADEYALYQVALMSRFVGTDKEGVAAAALAAMHYST